MNEKIKLTIVENGPVQVSEFESITFCGEPLQTGGTVFLCRCGESQNAPFCDASHRKKEEFR